MHVQRCLSFPSGPIRFVVASVICSTWLHRLHTGCEIFASTQQRHRVTWPSCCHASIDNDALQASVRGCLSASRRNVCMDLGSTPASLSSWLQGRRVAALDGRCSAAVVGCFACTQGSRLCRSLWAKRPAESTSLATMGPAQSRMNHKRHTSVMLLVSFASRARKAITVATHEQPNAAPPACTHAIYLGIPIQS